MSQTSSKTDREAQARRDIGRTEVRRPIQWVLLVFFILAITIIPLSQQIHDLRQQRAPSALNIFRAIPRAWQAGQNATGSAIQKLMAGNNSLLTDMKDFEDALSDDSRFSQAVLPVVQSILTGQLGAGNEKAYIGRHGWLFFRPEVDYLTGPGFLDPLRLKRRRESGTERIAAPQPDPRRAVLQFRDQLAARGIQLILLPVPCKPMIHPETFAAAYDQQRVALQNISFAQFKSELETAGVPVLDLAQPWMDHKWQTGAPQFLETDTHWRPEAMQWAAQRLRDFLRQHAPLPARPPAPYTAVSATATNRGDIATMLKLPARQQLYQPQSVPLRVIRDGERLWRPNTEADVLLLGDSFANIYSLEPMGWGEAAGFAEQLAYELQRPLDVIVRNDAGAFATRQILSRDLARGKDRLAGKKVVIWQFAIRELAVGDWKLFDMILGEKPASRFVVPARGTEKIVTGTVEAIAPAPRPGAVPYKDHIVAAHLTELADPTGLIAGGETLVYLWSMRDNVWTPAARYRPGQKITVKIRPWSDVEGMYGAINRNELPDETLQLEEPCWAEEVKP